MKKFMNGVDTILTESLDGFAAAHADIVALGGGHKFVRRKALKPGKVALLSGGGSATSRCMPASSAWGMLDGACPGQVFTSPTPDQMLEAAAEIDTGAGVLLIVKNYEGDVMNFEMAAEMASGRSIRWWSMTTSQSRIRFTPPAAAASREPSWSKRSSARRRSRVPTSQRSRRWASASTRRRARWAWR